MRGFQKATYGTLIIIMTAVIRISRNGTVNNNVVPTRWHICPAAKTAAEQSMVILAVASNFSQLAIMNHGKHAKDSATVILAIALNFSQPLKSTSINDHHANESKYTDLACRGGEMSHTSSWGISRVKPPDGYTPW